ncbi:MAG: HAD hydrolase family protein [Candidatus Omnitrophica bacterium]|nr:HAD hydrolase family protein [Candidatus Omnitrophota bacterium]
MKTKSILAKAKKIKLLMLDVDGVLTDGRIIYDSSGRDLKLFDVQDGLGVYLLSLMGIKTVLVTAKGSSVITPRAKSMRVAAVYKDIFPKTKVLESVKKRFRVSVDAICFVGDDLVDYSIMKKCGLSIAVSNACKEIKQIAHFTTKKAGGRGAVREVVEILLKAQGLWKKALSLYE